MPRKQKIPPPLLAVQVLEAKPNPLFSEEQRSWVRFLRYNQTLPCAECGKKRRVMWTMLCSFRAFNMTGNYGPLEKTTTKQHPPLTPVCGAHPLAPAIAAPDQSGKDNPNAAQAKNPSQTNRQAENRKAKATRKAKAQG